MKYCEEMIQDIEKGIKLGLSHKAVCGYVGIVEDTFYRWMKRSEFSERIKKAEGEMKAYHLSEIAKAGKKMWQAHSWLLERCFPDEFAQKQRFGIDGDGSISITFDVVDAKGKDEPKSDDKK